jgi:hypothetical protein
MRLRHRGVTGIKHSARPDKVAAAQVMDGLQFGIAVVGVALVPMVEAYLPLPAGVRAIALGEQTSTARSASCAKA